MAIALPLPNIAALMKLAQGGTPEGSDESREGSESSSTESKEEINIEDVEFQYQRKMSKLQGVAFSCVLEDCVDLLQILGSMGGQPKLKADTGYKTIEAKYGDKQQQNYIFDPDTLEPYESSIKSKMFLKYQHDIAYIEQILADVNEEIVTKQEIVQFVEKLNEFYKMQEEREELKNDTEANLKKVATLRIMLENEKYRSNIELQEKSQDIAKLRNEYEDITYQNYIKERYTDEWESARVYQNDFIVKKTEDRHMHDIKELRVNCAKELRIHSEIDRFETELQETYLKDIDKWMEDYDNELDRKEIEIQFINEKRLKQLTHIQELSSLYDLHKRELEEYTMVREIRIKEEAELERQTIAAVKIQAWWRGEMFRRKLGPYRKKKGRRNRNKAGTPKKGKKEKKKK